MRDMRVCWNWQTGTFEGRVFRRTGSSPVTRTIFIHMRKDGRAGRRRTTGTRVNGNVSRVRIPLFPPNKPHKYAVCKIYRQRIILLNELLRHLY
jgi:hypothetical protein